MSKNILLKNRAKTAPKKATHTKAKLKMFSYKELHIIKLICEELNSTEIGEKLNTTTRAIHSIREDIMIKTESKNLAGIVKFAIKNKIYLLK